MELVRDYARTMPSAIPERTRIRDSRPRGRDRYAGSVDIASEAERPVACNHRFTVKRVSGGMRMPFPALILLLALAGCGAKPAAVAGADENSTSIAITPDEEPAPSGAPAGITAIDAATGDGQAMPGRQRRPVRLRSGAARRAGKGPRGGARGARDGGGAGDGRRRERRIGGGGGLTWARPPRICHESAQSHLRHPGLDPGSR